MQKLIRFPSIEQFRSVVRNVGHKSSYIGMDENGDAIYNNLRPKPTLKFEGTVKLHGTCGNFCVSPSGEYWVQSRENIINPLKDNAGFALFCETNKKVLLDIAVNVACLSDPSGMINDDIFIAGEWCGGNIQSGVALNQLPKMFVIFGIAFVDAEGQKTYLTRQQVKDVCNGVVQVPGGCIPDASYIYCIYDFPMFETEIDFENPHESVNIMNAITSAIGDECPVGKAFGVSGIGEGCVWRSITLGYEDSGFWHKVKDERHSKSKVKTLATVDVEKINDIKLLAETLAHEGRLQQQFDLVFDTLNGGEPDIGKMGEFIQATMKDIFKEDIDVIAASGFTGKELNGPISKITRDFMLRKLEV